MKRFITEAYMAYQEYLLKRGIPKEISGAPGIFDFVQLNFSAWGLDTDLDNLYRTHEFDFGKHEFGDITSNKKSITEIKSAIYSSIIDVDQMGRDTSQKALKQLIKNPHKSLKYHFTKGFLLYLLPENTDDTTVELKYSNNIHNLWSDSYDKSFAKIWDKYIELDKARVWKTLSRV